MKWGDRVTFDSREFRNTLGHFATGVTVVTLWRDGALHGMTANAFSSVSLDPPLVLVCVGKTGSTHALIQASGRFAVNILSEEQEYLSRYFAGNKDPSVTIALKDEPDARSPILDGAIAWLDCALWQSYDGGDQTIFVARVEALKAVGGRPLLFFQGKYARLPESR